MTFGIMKKRRLLLCVISIVVLRGLLFAQTTPCTAVDYGSLTKTTCADIGSSNFFVPSPNGPFSNNTTSTPPSGLSMCDNNPFTTQGAWYKYNPEDDITKLLVYPNSVSSASGGNYVINVAYFQGSNCSSLTQIGCTNPIYFSSGLQFSPREAIHGIDGTQDLWIYIYSTTTGKSVVGFDMDIVAAAAPSNSICPGTGVSDGDIGCNLGASPPNPYWHGPGAPIDSGGSGSLLICGIPWWSSNENTVYYQVTAQNTTASIDLTSITCNDGQAGTAQVGVWTGGCSSIGVSSSYTNGNFLGCAVGSGGTTLSLSGLTVGQEYIIVVDGNAGDVCTWVFDIVDLTSLATKDISFQIWLESNKPFLRWSSSTSDIDKFTEYP